MWKCPTFASEEYIYVKLESKQILACHLWVDNGEHQCSRMTFKSNMWNDAIDIGSQPCFSGSFPQQSTSPCWEKLHPLNVSHTATPDKPRWYHNFDECYTMCSCESFQYERAFEVSVCVCVCTLLITNGFVPR